MAESVTSLIESLFFKSRRFGTILFVPAFFSAVNKDDKDFGYYSSSEKHAETQPSEISLLPLAPLSSSGVNAVSTSL